MNRLSTRPAGWSCLGGEVKIPIRQGSTRRHRRGEPVRAGGIPQNLFLRLTATWFADSRVGARYGRRKWSARVNKRTLTDLTTNRPVGEALPVATRVTYHAYRRLSKGHIRVCFQDPQRGGCDPNHG